MSDLVGNPNCWFSHAKAQKSLRFLFHKHRMVGIMEPFNCSHLFIIHTHDLTFEPPRGKTNNVVSEQV